MKGSTKKRGVERRAHARFERTVNAEGAEGNGGAVARMVTRDLSLGGVYCISAEDFPEMTRLAVRLLIEDPGRSNGPEPLDVEAVVVRRRELPSKTQSSKFELGLFFTGMSDVARERLARFLASSENPRPA